MYDMLVPLIQKLVQAGDLTWTAAIRALSCNSTKIAVGTTTSLTIGEAANLTLIDPSHEWTLDASSQLSRGTNQALAQQN